MTVEIWHPTVGQRVDITDHGWTVAEGHRDAESPYLEEHGFTGEDWNFATADAIPALDDEDGPTWVLGYGQGVVGQERVKRAIRTRSRARFDVLFYTIEEGLFLIQGAYLDARQLGDAERQILGSAQPPKLSRHRPSWQAWQRILARREDEIERALTDNRRATSPKVAVATFRRDNNLRWAVAPENVVRFDPPIPVQPGYQSRRFRNAFDWSQRSWRAWTEAHLADDTPPPTPDDGDDLEAEGRKRLAIHTRRERSVKNRRLIKKRHLDAGTFTCACCGLDPALVYGNPYTAALHLHHGVPVSTADEEKGFVPEEKDLVLLCATCHGVAHATQRLPVPELQELLGGWRFPNPPAPPRVPPHLPAT